MIAQAASRNDRFIAAPVPVTNVSTELRRRTRPDTSAVTRRTTTLVMMLAASTTVEVGQAEARRR
jgi:hypothetical protein